MRTPYDKDTLENQVTQGWTEFFLKHGYAVVLQSERGRFFSEGKFENFLQGASTDGYDTVEWIAKQSWSNGKVGTIGCSSSAEQQWPMAASQPPGHTAMVAVSSGMVVGDIPGNATQGTMYRGGVPLIGIWPWWYANIARTERLLLPANSSQAERIRLRNSYSLLPRDFNLLSPASESGRMQLSYLPSQDLLRNLNVALSPMDRYLTWGPADPGWKNVERIRAGSQPRVPALHMESWHDLAVGEATRFFKYQQDLGTPDQYLIVSPGPHCLTELSLLKKGSSLADFKYGDLEIGDARYNGLDRGYSKLYLDWFGYWLKGEESRIREMPKVQLFVMGKGWITGDQWPLKQVRFTDYYLGPHSTTSDSPGTGALSPARSNYNAQDSYRYDPGDPTPSIGIGDMDDNAFDQRPVEARKDVLVYSTPPLENALTIAGPIEVVLYVSSSAKDTDFMVRLTDVFPDGKSINLTDDAFRVRYRESFHSKALMRRGEIYPIRFTNMVTAVRFAKGHRIRLDISSSSFPLYERNLNSGGNNFDETKWVVAENSVHHGKSYPSHIVLPVLPE